LFPVVNFLKCVVTEVVLFSIYRNGKGQNTDRTLAVTKGLVGQVERLVEKLPPPAYFLW